MKQLRKLTAWILCVLMIVSQASALVLADETETRGRDWPDWATEVHDPEDITPVVVSLGAQYWKDGQLSFHAALIGNDEEADPLEDPELGIEWYRYEGNDLVVIEAGHDKAEFVLQDAYDYSSTLPGCNTPNAPVRDMRGAYRLKISKGNAYVYYDFEVVSLAEQLEDGQYYEVLVEGTDEDGMADFGDYYQLDLTLQDPAWSYAPVPGVDFGYEFSWLKNGQTVADYRTLTIPSMGSDDFGRYDWNCVLSYMENDGKRHYTSIASGDTTLKSRAYQGYELGFTQHEGGVFRLSQGQPIMDSLQLLDPAGDPVDLTGSAVRVEITSDHSTEEAQRQIFETYYSMDLEFVPGEAMWNQVDNFWSYGYGYIVNLYVDGVKAAEGLLTIYNNDAFIVENFENIHEDNDGNPVVTIDLALQRDGDRTTALNPDDYGVTYKWYSDEACWDVIGEGPSITLPYDGYAQEVYFRAYHEVGDEDYDFYDGIAFVSGEERPEDPEDTEDPDEGGTYLVYADSRESSFSKAVNTGDTLKDAVVYVDEAGNELEVPEGAQLVIRTAVGSEPVVQTQPAGDLTFELPITEELWANFDSFWHVPCPFRVVLYSADGAYLASCGFDLYDRDKMLPWFTVEPSGKQGYLELNSKIYKYSDYDHENPVALPESPAYTFEWYSINSVGSQYEYLGQGNNVIIGAENFIPGEAETTFGYYVYDENGNYVTETFEAIQNPNIPKPSDEDYNPQNVIPNFFANAWYWTEGVLHFYISGPNLGTTETEYSYYWYNSDKKLIASILNQPATNKICFDLEDAYNYQLDSPTVDPAGTYYLVMTQGDFYRTFNFEVKSLPDYLKFHSTASGVFIPEIFQKSVEKQAVIGETYTMGMKINTANDVEPQAGKDYFLQYEWKLSKSGNVIAGGYDQEGEYIFGASGIYTIKEEAKVITTDEDGGHALEPAFAAEDAVTAVYDLSSSRCKVAITTPATNIRYTGKQVTPAVKVTYTFTDDEGEKKTVTLKAGTVYKVTYGTNRLAGSNKAVVKISSVAGKSIGSKSLAFTIRSASQPLTVKLSSTTVPYNRTLARRRTLKVTGAKGKVTYTSSSKYVKVSSTGVVTIAKGAPRGTYTITVKAAAVTSRYLATTKKITLKIVR